MEVSFEVSAGRSLPVAPEAFVDSRVLEYVHLVRDAVRDELKQVVLFGSRAMQTCREDSDYDIALFVDHPVSRTAVLEVASRLSYPFVVAGLDIRPVIIEVDRWDEDSEFLEHIRSHGRSLYEAAINAVDS